MAVITPPWCSLQEADLVSFLTQLETRVGGRGPTDHFCPLEETKQITCESLLHMCLCTFLGSPPQIESSQDSRPLLLAVLVSQGFILLLGNQACRASFHGWAVSWLRWKRRRWSEDAATPAIYISTTWRSHPDKECRHFWGWPTSTAFWHGQGCSGFTGVSVCCCRGVHPCNPWSTGNLHSVFSVGFLGIHKRCREMGTWQAKLSCQEGIASVKLIQNE